MQWFWSFRQNLGNDCINVLFIEVNHTELEKNLHRTVFIFVHSLHVLKQVSCCIQGLKGTSTGMDAGLKIKPVIVSNGYLKITMTREEGKLLSSHRCNDDDNNDDQDYRTNDYVQFHVLPPHLTSNPSTRYSKLVGSTWQHFCVDSGVCQYTRKILWTLNRCLTWSTFEVVQLLSSVQDLVDVLGHDVWNVGHLSLKSLNFLVRLFLWCCSVFRSKVKVSLSYGTKERNLPITRRRSCLDVNEVVWRWHDANGLVVVLEREVVKKEVYFNRTRGLTHQLFKKMRITSWESFVLFINIRASIIRETIIG